MIKEAIVKIVNKEDLTYDEAYTVMNEIMSGQTSPTQNAAFLAALSTKSARAETTDEIAGCAAAMRAHATKVETGMELFEIVGTGGDNAHSFNISTTSRSCGGGRRNEGGKARQPRGFIPVRNGRLSGSTRRKYSPESEKMYGAFKRSRDVLLFRPEISYFHEICGRYPQGTGLPHGVQYFRPAHQPRHCRPCSFSAYMTTISWSRLPRCS